MTEKKPAQVEAVGASFRVRVKDLIIDPRDNPRLQASYEGSVTEPGKEQAGLLLLGRSMKFRGQLQPIGVVKDAKTGRWRVHFGFRRPAAALLVGIEELWAVEVKDAAKDRTAAENIGRKNLHAVEVVLAVKGILDDWAEDKFHPCPRPTNADLGRAVGLAEGAASNYACVARRAAPRLLAEWSKRPGLFTFVEVLELVRTADHQAQYEWMLSRLGGDGGPVQKARRPRGQGPAYARKALEKLKGEVERGRHDARGEDWCQGALHACAVALGEVVAKKKARKR